MGRIVWPDKKGGIPSFKQYLDDMNGVELQDIWADIPPVGAQAKERTRYPTQKPVSLVQRIVGTASRPGDVVLDAFVGSGTTLVACDTMSEPRRWIGIDCGKLAIYTTQQRLLQLGADRRTLLKTAPFVEFRSFALGLFQCRDEPHSIGKVPLDGYRELDHVLVFNFQKHRDAVLDESYIDDLHRALGDRIDRRFFIISPAASVRFLQDYVERKGSRHPIRYFVLRIPYSIIDELHDQGFTRLQQPVSEPSINETIDSVGFDFIQPPIVDCVYRNTGNELSVAIKKFEAEGMIRGSDNPVGLDALAMVMIDVDYGGAVFEVDQVFYAEDLTRSGFRMSIPVKTVGRQIMLIYVDVYGNEHREVKTLRDFKRAGGR